MAEAPEEKLPFHIPTLLKGIWKRRLWIVAGMVVSVMIGVVAGQILGAQTYVAETVLIYKSAVTQRRNESRQVAGRVRALETSLNLVKLKSNLEECRRRLKMVESTEAIGTAVEVYVQQNTNLMTIRADWNNPQTAADIANALREIFLENQARMIKEDRQKLAELEGLFKEVDERLVRAEGDLRAFTTTNNLVDIDKQSESYLSEMADIGKRLSEAEFERKKLQLQMREYDRIVAGLKAKAQEEEQSNQAMEGLAEVNLRFRRLRDAITDDKSHRASIALLAQKELEYDRAKRLYAKDLIPEAQLEKTKAEYERLVALSVDTPQIKEWKDEIRELDKIMIPQAGATQSTSGRLLQQVMLKSFEIQLSEVAAEERVRHLRQVQQQTKAKLDSLTSDRQQYDRLKRKVGNVAEEHRSVEELLADARLDESQSAHFYTVAPAKVPHLPSQSTTILITAGLALMGIIGSFALVLGRELTDFSVKSLAELRLKMDRVILGELPVMAEDGYLPGRPFKVIAAQVRIAAPKRGVRLLINSAQPGEGKTMVAINLAQSFARQEERVLLIDAQVRFDDPDSTFADIIAEEDEPAVQRMGLGEYLSYETDDLGDVIHPTKLPGVDCLPRIGQAVMMDLIGSNRMEELLERVSARYSIVLIEPMAILPYADTELMAQLVDGVVEVIRSQKTKAADAKAALERLDRAGVPVIGLVLNAVTELYYRG